MRSRTVVSVLCASALGLSASAVSAAPQLRVQVDQRGDFVLIGNTLAHDCAAATPAPIVGTVGACGDDWGDSSPDVYWRSDSPADGQAAANTGVAASGARSTAVLNLPPGAVVTHAYLYWGATLATAGDDLSVTFERPGVFTQTVNAIEAKRASFDSHWGYQSVANVTTLVAHHGAGAYRIGGVTTENFIDLSKDTSFAGWWMAVFYQLPTDPPRNLALFDGFDTVSPGVPATAALSGFLVPSAAFTGKLGVVAYEGDGTITGDSLFFNGGAALSDALNPGSDFFNSTRSHLGSAVSVAGDLPQLTGGSRSMSGLDLDVVDVTAKLSAGLTSAPIQATSTGDVFLLGGFVTSISTFRPEFSTSTKAVQDVDGGALLAGDVLEYTIVVTNTGNDTSLNTVLRDPLPTGVTFVPGSLRITQGPNAGTKTDAAGDDQATYDAATRTAVFRLGAGANGTNGGTMAVGQSTTVTLQVKVDAAASGTLSNQATITASGQLGAPSTTTNTDGNGNGPGSPSTDVIVDECADAATCAAPTPFCKTVAHPYVCVECGSDADCPGLKPSCNVTTNTCSCVATGPEICDGKDNDCDGTIDEGFPEICAACTNDPDCGGPNSGRVCNDTSHVCVDGCRGQGGNGCPAGEICSSTTAIVGICKEAPDAGVTPDAGVDPGVTPDAGSNVEPPIEIPSNDGFELSGSGLSCASRPGAPSAGLGWILGSVALAALRRRRRSK